MKYRRRIYYSASQRAEIWDRWQRGESMSSIGRVFERQSSSVFSVISPTGGIRPPNRKRTPLGLSLAEREEISRGLNIKQTFRAIARQLQRAPSTICPAGADVRHSIKSSHTAKTRLVGYFCNRPCRRVQKLHGAPDTKGLRRLKRRCPNMLGKQPR